MYRPFDVLYPLFPQIIDRNIELSFNRLIDSSRDTNAARFCQCFQPCRHIYAVAVDLIAVNDDIAQINPDSETHLTVCGNADISIRELALSIKPAFYCTRHGAKFRQNGITSKMADSTAMAFDFLGKLGKRFAQGKVCAFFVSTGQPTIAGDIRIHDGG